MLEKYEGDELFDMVAHSLIRQGRDRSVYIFAPDHDIVLKVERNERTFANAHEWATWSCMKDDPLGKWLAPCIAISRCGKFLLQERTEPIPERQLPKRVPEWFRDVAHRNFGFYKGRVVCHDYGLVETERTLIGNGRTIAMKKAVWNDITKTKRVKP